MAEKQFAATRDFLLPLPGETIPVAQGDLIDLEEVPAGSRETLCNHGWLVPVDEYQPDGAPSADSDETSEEGQSTDWKATELASLDLPESVLESLEKVGVLTVADVLSYGAEHGDLQEIDGIGKASEKKLQEAIAAIPR